MVSLVLKVRKIFLLIALLVIMAIVFAIMINNFLARRQLIVDNVLSMEKLNFLTESLTSG